MSDFCEKYTEPLFDDDRPRMKELEMLIRLSLILLNSEAKRDQWLTFIRTISKKKTKKEVKQLLQFCIARRIWILQGKDESCKDFLNIYGVAVNSK